MNKKIEKEDEIKNRINVLLTIAKGIAKVDRELTRLYFWRAFSLSKRYRVKLKVKRLFCRKCFEFWDNEGVEIIEKEKATFYKCKRCSYIKRIKKD